jgi:hypothetical protein
MAEAAVAAAIDRELTRRQVYTVNITGTGMSRNGIPDRLCCHLGHFLAIEIKGAARQDHKTAGLGARAGRLRRRHRDRRPHGARRDPGTR